MAGVLAGGDDTRLAGASACQAYEVFKKRTGTVHVVRRGAAARWGRLRIHSMPALPPRRKRKGIPVVPIEEALLGLAADETVPDGDVRRAVRQAQVMKLTDHQKLIRHARRSKGRPGIRRFRELVGDRPAPTRSELEDAALDFLLRYGFDPRCNAIVDGREADFVLEDGTIVELDSEAFHDNFVAAADDASKWSAKRRVERLTWDDVHVTPVRTARRLRRGSP